MSMVPDHFVDTNKMASDGWMGRMNRALLCLLLFFAFGCAVKEPMQQGPRAGQIGGAMPVEALSYFRPSPGIVRQWICRTGIVLKRSPGAMHDRLRGLRG